MDGTGAPWFRADIGIRGDRIVRIGDLHAAATFDDPNHYSIGVKWVLVNGRAVVADGKITTERPGRPLRGPGYRK